MTAGRATAVRRSGLLAAYRSDVGKKYAMAITGVGLMAFVAAHSYGNLKLYLGAAQLDHYAEFLRDLGTPIFPRTVALWGLRIGLVVAFAVHLHAAWTLTRRCRERRGEGYVSRQDLQVATIASRSMRWTGVVVLLFLGYHLPNFTWGWVNPGFVRGEVHRNVLAAFRNPAVALWYVVANVALGLHLFHGAWSIFQSLGVTHPQWNRWRRPVATGFAVAVTAANVSIPIAASLGLV